MRKCCVRTNSSAEMILKDMVKNKMDPVGGSGGLLLAGWSLPRHAFDTLMTLYKIATALLLVVPAYLIYRKATHAEASGETTTEGQEADQEPKTIMQPARTDLDPPKDDPFTLEQLREFDGSDPSKPVYVSIKGVYQAHRIARGMLKTIRARYCVRCVA